MTVLNGVLIVLAGSLAVNFSLWRTKREVEHILAKIVTVLMAERHPMFVTMKEEVDNG
jgi:hypothetical protein